jgi:serine/threonine protein kinase
VLVIANVLLKLLKHDFLGRKKYYKDKSVNCKLVLFTKAVDVYRYGMTYYEILTKKLPFWKSSSK